MRPGVAFSVWLASSAVCTSDRNRFSNWLGWNSTPRGGFLPPAGEQLVIGVAFASRQFRMGLAEPDWKTVPEPLHHDRQARLGRRLAQARSSGVSPRARCRSYRPGSASTSMVALHRGARDGIGVIGTRVE